MKYSLLFILVLVFTNFLHAGSIPELLPKDNTCADWLKTGKLEYYQTDELFFLINGGADLYLEYGFKEVVAQTYQNNANSQISVEIYNMGSDDSAFGIFANSKTSDGEAANMGDKAWKSKNALIIWKGHYFILLRSANQDESVSEGFCLLADQVLNKIPGKGNIPPLIEKLQLDPDQVLYYKGSIGLNSVYYFGAADIFQIDEVLVDKSDESIRLFFAYPSQNKADSVYQAILPVLSQKSKFVNTEVMPDCFVLTDKKEQKLRFETRDNEVRVTISK